jgi:hypothetical protein
MTWKGNTSGNPRVRGRNGNHMRERQRDDDGEACQDKKKERISEGGEEGIHDENEFRVYHITYTRHHTKGEKGLRYDNLMTRGKCEKRRVGSKKPTEKKRDGEKLELRVYF